MMGFTFVPTEKVIEGHIGRGYCVCDTCGIRVETGIFNLAEHWSQCSGKEEFRSMLKDPQAYIARKKNDWLIESAELENKVNRETN